ncbi:MAG: hypothetical protein ATN31_00965 [Candidatus Epulonipiscioides saccharophilum]|nr:MAG: hypothetical protein ATN31_00965 [Epulopiscium sp. AS2M-Bin001]
MDNLLPAWGPYSKKYMGVSNIIADGRGIRFDTVVHPTIVNSSIPVPNVTFPSGYHPWEASADLTYFCYRYDLIWKDELYADVSFSAINDETMLIRIEFVNNTKLPRNCMLNYFHAIEYPFKTFTDIEIADNSIFIHCLDYEYFSQTEKRPWDNLQPDGRKKGEFLDPNFVRNQGLGDRVPKKEGLIFKKFGEGLEDKVGYSIIVENNIADAYLVFGYRTCTQDDASFKLSIANYYEIVNFSASSELITASIKVGDIERGKVNIDLLALAKGGIEFNFIVITQNPQAVQLTKGVYNFVPETTIDENKQFKFIYDGIPTQFYFKCISNKVRRRRLNTGTLEDCTISRLSNSDPSFDNVLATFTDSFKQKKSDLGFYENILVHSIFIPENSRHVEYAIVSNQEILFDSTTYFLEKLEQIYLKARDKYQPINYKREGSKYVLSNEILQSTTLTNIVYPIYKYGEYVKHFTPGKRWDCLYTWDSGFVGLGLLEYDPKLAEYTLDMYLSDVPDYAFLMHGTPVPVQIYLLLELMQRTQNFEYYKKYYHKAKRFYNFLAGKSEGSTTAKFKSGMTTTFDYFYNASGMDDLPAQVYTHNNKLAQKMAAVVSTSQVIRSAKILRMMAERMDLTEDVLIYNIDIENFTDALQNYSWDVEAGYFSYVYHDENGNPLGFLKTEKGENFNKSVDGIYPIIAGACTEEQKNIILERLKSPERLFSHVGISSVDLSASYFDPNGYWNGSVWFPHQWFIYKTMLDIGETDFAYKIANTALESWKKEVDDSYYTFELLNIATGRGGWFHNFGGLSTPINIWANIYYKAGTVTTGFETWIEEAKFSEDFTQCSITIKKTNIRTDSAVIISMAEDIHRAIVKCSIKNIAFTQRIRGTFEFIIPSGTKEVVIQID